MRDLWRSSNALDYLKISILAFALAGVFASLDFIILPVRLLDFVSEDLKNTPLGLLSFADLVVAVLAQPFAEALSDSPLSLGPLAALHIRQCCRYHPVAVRRGPFC